MTGSGLMRSRLRAKELMNNGRKGCDYHCCHCVLDPHCSSLCLIIMFYQLLVYPIAFVFAWFAFV